jgi:hypothetical protein
MPRRRHALSRVRSLAGRQLPDRINDARAVLRYVEAVVDGFLAADSRPSAPVRLAAATPFPGRSAVVLDREA